MKLYFNPVSSYSQKALIAFYEKNVKFEPMIVNLMEAHGRADYEKVYPMGKVPYLVPDKGENVPESTSIIEYLERHVPAGPKLIPADPELAAQVRTWDRFFDCYVNEPMQKIFFDGMRPSGKNDPVGVAEARARLDKAYAILDQHIANKTWAVGKDFSMADCAAAPPLGYARMVHPFEKWKNVVGYFNRLAERPSYARAIKEAEPILAAMTKK